jgi:cytoskeletal protein CcmA (bactofilin family)
MQTPDATRRPGSTLRVTGELIARENLNLEGTVDGTITLEGFALTAGVGARVNGSVTAKVVTVLGQLKGHITADVVEIVEGATVEASVIAQSFSLDDGAIFTGPVNTERARAAGEVARHRLATRGTSVPNSGKPRAVAATDTDQPAASPAARA